MFNSGKRIINTVKVPRRSINFLSRLLTPLYQSDLWWAGGLRDLSFAWMYRIPYFRKEMAVTISGLKLGMFSQMNYRDIAKQNNHSV